MVKLVNDCLIKLKKIARIQEHDKLSTKGNDLAIEEDNKLQGVKRWLYGDSRRDTLSAIKQVVEEAIELSNFIMVSTHLNVYDIKRNVSMSEEHTFQEYGNMLNQFATELANVQRGITNLKTSTYNNDVDITAHLEVILATITNHIGILRKKLESVKRSVKSNQAMKQE